MKRTLMVIGIPFLATIFGLSYTSPTVVIVLATLGVVLNYLGYNNKTMLVTIIISIVFAFNTITYHHEQTYFDTTPFDGISGTIIAHVVDISPTSNGTSKAYTINVLGSDIPNLPSGFDGIVYADFDVFVDYYDVISVNMICNHITQIEGFDFSAYYNSIGVSMQFYSYSTPKIIQNNNHTLYYKIKKFGDSLCDIFDKHFTQYYAGMIKAMLLGDNSNLDDTLYSNASRSGVSHIFVVSGLHIALLVGLLDKFLSITPAPKITRQLLLIVLTWGLVLLTGGKISSIRAGIMITFVLISPIFKRNNDSLNSVFGAGVIIIAQSPYTITSLSFQLSFSATLGIIVLYKKIETLLLKCITKNRYPDQKPAHIVSAIISGVSVTLSATIGMLPVYIIVFKGISIICLVANVLVVPLMPFVLIMGSAFLFCNSIPWLAGGIKLITLILLYIIKTVTNTLGGFKYAYLGLDFPIVYPYIWALIIILTTMYLLKIQDKRFKAICILTFTVCILTTSYITNYNVVTLTVFSNTKGNSILLSNRGNATIINIQHNTNDTYIASYMQSKNILNIDRVVSLNDSTNTDYSIFNKDDSYLNLISGDITYIIGEISGLDILITNSIEVASSYEYDILLIETDEYFTPIDNKRVILLNDHREVTQRRTIKFKV